MTTSEIDWSSVDRTITKAGKQLRQGKNSEDFQMIGLLCREALVSLSQAVSDPSRHKVKDGLNLSPTDSKRMLEAFLCLNSVEDQTKKLDVMSGPLGNFSANIVLRQCGNRRDVRKFLSFLGCNNDGKEDQDDSDALKRCYCLLENEVCKYRGPDWFTKDGNGNHAGFQMFQCPVNCRMTDELGYDSKQ